MKDSSSSLALRVLCRDAELADVELAFLLVAKESGIGVSRLLNWLAGPSEGFKVGGGK